MTIGVFCCRCVLDRYVRRMSSRAAMKPEQRLMPMVAGGFAIPVGLVWWGWAVQLRAHWLVAAAGLAICGFSVAVTLIPAFSYLVHAFGMYSASAIAGVITLRCLSGVVLPLAGPPLYARFGLGWGNSLLALVALCFVPVPIIPMWKGEVIRGWSNLDKAA